jgi:hypothetical protein
MFCSLGAIVMMRLCTYGCVAAGIFELMLSTVHNFAHLGVPRARVVSVEGELFCTQHEAPL